MTPTFLFAVLLWGAVLRELNERQAGPAPDLAQLMQACDTVLRAQQSRVAIPRRFGIPMRELLMLQPRFNRRSGVKSLSLLQHPRFRAAYDFLLLRAQVGVADPELAKWWTDIQCCRKKSAWRWFRRARPSRRRGGRRCGTRPVDAAAGGAAERRALKPMSLALAPRVCGDRQQSEPPARAGAARHSSGSRRCPRRVLGAAFAPLPNPAHGTAGSAGLRERGGGFVDSAGGARVARRRCSGSNGPWAEIAQERWGPRVIDLDLMWMLGRDDRRARIDAAASRSVEAQLRPVSFGRYRPHA